MRHLGTQRPRDPEPAHGMAIADNLLALDGRLLRKLATTG